MYKIAENSIRIDCRPDIVFGYVSNLENFGEWFPGVLEIDSASEGAHGSVGKKYKESVKGPFGKKNTVIIEVKEVDPNQRLVTEAEFAPLLPRMDIRFDTQNGEQTVVSWRMDSRTESRLFSLLFLPFIRRVMEKRAQLGMVNLKNLLEA